MIRDTAIAAVAFTLGVLFMLSWWPSARDNAVHRERMRSMEKGVGTYYLDTREGRIAFQYLDIDEYTKWVLSQIQTGRAVPVNPLRDTQ